MSDPQPRVQCPSCGAWIRAGAQCPVCYPEDARRVPHVPWTAHDDEQLIAWTRQMLPVADIAERLGRSYGAVITRRGQLRRAGTIERLGYAGHLEWTRDEEVALEELLEEGYSIERCAKKLKRNVNSVRIKYKRLGVRLRTDRRTLTCRDVARIMELGCQKIVPLWVERGWLTPLKQKRPHGGAWRFDELALWSFVEIHEAHMAWEPERITDPELRHHAQEIRATVPRWLRPSEVARRYGVTHATVNQWIHKGLLSGVKYSNWWIREDSLIGFVVPCEVSKKRVMRGRYYVCCTRRLPFALADVTDPRKLICDRCRPTFQELSTGTLLRIRPVRSKRARYA